MGSSTFLIAITVVGIFLVAAIVLKPRMTVTRGGKMLAFVSLFVFPVLATSMGATEHMERSKTTAFCLQCHEMGNYGKSLQLDDPSFLPAAHYQNNRVPRQVACYTCHTDYTLYGGVGAKWRGLRHVYVQVTGKVPEKLALYTPYNNRECLHCHGGSRSFEEGATHNMEPDRIARIKSNELSCLSSGCHESVHNIDGLKDAKFWTGVKSNGEGN
jgi:cytochrome c-type protein NapC